MLRDIDQRLLPLLSPCEVDQRVADCRIVSATAAQLSPGDKFAHGLDHSFEETRLFVRVIQYHPVFAGLQATQHIGFFADDDRGVKQRPILSTSQRPIVSILSIC